MNFYRTKHNVLALALRDTRKFELSRVLFVLLLAVNFSNAGHAEDTLPSSMQRMKSDEAVRIAYREIRTLELMDRPWQGAGYMYSLPPDLMIKEQLQPERLLMGVKGDRMFYFDPANDVRRQGDMAPDNPVSQNIAVFKALINADEALLHRWYRVEFASKPRRWVMTLKPKQHSDSAFSIEIAGLPGQQADSIKISQDHDISEFSLRKDASGDEVEAVVKQLYRELSGD